jgi:MFS family permease
LTDRIGSRAVLLTCTAISIVGYALQYPVRSVGALTGFQIVTGFAMGGILASLSAYLASLAPQGQEGTIYGINASVTSVSNAIGPMVGSALSVSCGLRFPFLVSAGAMILSGIAALTMGRESQPRERSDRG